MWRESIKAVHAFFILPADASIVNRRNEKDGKKASP